MRKLIFLPLLLALSGCGTFVPKVDTSGAENKLALAAASLQSAYNSAAIALRAGHIDVDTAVAIDERLDQATALWKVAANKIQQDLPTDALGIISQVTTIINDVTRALENASTSTSHHSSRDCEHVLFHSRSRKCFA